MTNFPRFSLEGEGDRILILGATGEGKTANAYWQLSRANFHEMPWYVFDYKRDTTLANLERMGWPVVYDSRKTPGKPFPAPTTRPGLYIMRPEPEQAEEVNDFLASVWRQGNTGLYFDEGYMIPQKQKLGAYNKLLIQGRSLNIPMIMLYQRPVDMSQYVTSQSEFWAVYRLRKPGDFDKVDEYIVPAIINGRRYNSSLTDPEGNRLPRYYWLWYDEREGDTKVMQPVPIPAVSTEVFARRLAKTDDRSALGATQRPTLGVV